MEKVFLLHHFNCSSCHVRVLLNIYTQSNNYGCLWFLDYLLASSLVLDECSHNQKNSKNMWADKTHKGKNSERKENNRIASESLAFILFGNFQLWQKMFAGCQMLP